MTRHPIARARAHAPGLRRLTRLLIALIPFAWGTQPTAAAPAAGPNIVVILADDLGYGDVQSLNPQRGKVPTPHLDRLASQGMAFTRAHSGSSVCTPTRYGLLTGRYAWRTHLQHGVFSGYVEPLIAPDRLTLPALLKAQGYHTACIGKWHLGFTVDKPAPRGKNDQMLGAPLGAITADGPTTRGFDTYFGFHHARMMNSVFENDRVTRLVQPEDMLSVLTQQSIAHIQRRAATGQPFFLYLALSSPHTPILPTEAWRGRSGLGKYADFVMQTDAAVGEVLDAIDRAGVASRTLVIFTSDNGCSTAADVKALEARGHFPSADARGYKSSIYEGGHRVPFIARWPDRIAAGSRSERLICLTDLMATCAELVGANVPDTAGEDSVSLLPELLGRPGVAPRPAVVHHSAAGRFAVRQGDWKLCLPRGQGKESEGAELYDMAKDPGESINLAKEHPEKLRELTGVLAGYIAQGRSTPGPKRNNDIALKSPQP